MTKYHPFIISALIGAVAWLGVGEWGGIEDSWDSPLYWKVGIPAMVFSIFFVAVVWPENPWRWGLTAAAAQAVVALVGAFPHINLWPLSLVAFAFVSLPLIAAAYGGSFVKKRIIEH